jgi:hypothetical protein
MEGVGVFFFFPFLSRNPFVWFLEGSPNRFFF